MALDPADVAAAVALQTTAAKDPRSQVRLVAGPGTGKSYSIEDRVAWLLESGVAAGSIFVASFTRASSADLRGRIGSHCEGKGLVQVSDVRVSTLHSMALRLMRLASLLTQYPVDPRVLDEWEMRSWIDQELARFISSTPGRAREVRRYHEAWWSTGAQNPANYVPPDPPITQAEQDDFAAYHGMQTGFWACVLLGEIVRRCMEQVKAGLVDPRHLLHMDHLVVDEYQDLNPMDLEFVDALIASGVTTFVAGDDDQSIYSFRYASPVGIQTFVTRHAAAGDHQLVHCFRCPPLVLQAAESMLQQFAAPQRIPKQQVSLHASATPPIQGSVALWRAPTGRTEAAMIATSCARLIGSGLPAGQIMILLGNARVLGAALYEALESAGVSFSPARGEPFSDGEAGRTGLSILRIISDPDDLVAHRDLLGLLVGVGPGKCLAITRRCTQGNMSAKDLFYETIPAKVLTPSLDGAVARVKAVIAAVGAWDESDTLAMRSTAIAQLVEDIRGVGDRDVWGDFVAPLPDGTTLAELRDFLFAENIDEAHRVLVNVHDRLTIDPPPETDPDRVQVMTMHGAKGLSAKVVFIPGLEENVFPNQRRAAVIGLVQEGARLLYVSVTRAKASVICSLAARRTQNGMQVWNTPSRYAAPLGVPAATRDEGLSEAEAQAITDIAAQT